MVNLSFVKLLKNIWMDGSIKYLYAFLCVCLCVCVCACVCVWVHVYVYVWLCICVSVCVCVCECVINHRNICVSANGFVGFLFGNRHNLKRVMASWFHGYNCMMEKVKGPMAWKSHFMMFSNINMSSPSLPTVLQWLKLAFGVKRALVILLSYEKMETQACCFGMWPHMSS